jgi:NlpC/P60 family putative phage cell wall peptidase
MNPGGDEIVAAALAWLGTPYRHQASTLGAGCDCLGLVRGVWRTLYGDEPWVVPPYRLGWRETGDGLREAAERFLVPADELAAGRVVLFRLLRTLPARHCGIIAAPRRFIHAQERIGVVAADLTESWARRVAGVFAFPER